MNITIFWNIIEHFLSLPISFKFSVKILASSNLTVNSLSLRALAYMQKQNHEFVRYFEWYSKHVILWKLRFLTITMSYCLIESYYIIMSHLMIMVRPAHCKISLNSCAHYQEYGGHQCYPEIRGEIWDHGRHSHL